MPSYSRFGQDDVYTLMQQPPAAPVSPEFWLSPPQDVRKYMTSISAALSFFNSTLDSIISYYTTITSGDPAKFDWAQAQFALDRMSLISAIQSVITDMTGGNPVSADFQSTVDTINGKLVKVGELYKKVLTLNPDIGQAALLQNIYQAKFLEAQKSGAPLPQKIQFTPGFTPKAPPIITVEPTTAQEIAKASGTTTGAKMNIGTVVLVLVGGFLAYQALK